MDDDKLNEPSDEETGHELAELFAPWDAKEWQNLKDRHSEVAAQLVQLVMDGVSAKAIRRYAEKHGYSPNAACWMEHCVLHIERQLAAGTSI